MKKWKEQAQPEEPLLKRHLQLENASLETNQQAASLPLETASQDASHHICQRSSAGREASPRGRAESVNTHTEKGSQVFLQQALQISTQAALQHSRSQPFLLWNPINSSAVPHRNYTLEYDGSVAAHPTASPTGDLTWYTKQLLPGSSPGGTLVTVLQSQSSLHVEVSLSDYSPTSPKDILAESSTRYSRPRRQSNALNEAGAMSPQPSTYSDAPSKRPPTPAKDLENGLPNADARVSRISTPSRHSRRASSTKSDLPWNPTHPCYPHPNPHVPLASPLYKTTRIIRIPRDWLIAGDLAPAFSNTYPEILEPWISEADFRVLIKDTNDGLIKAFASSGWRAWVDAIMGILTGWIWEDLGFAGVKHGAKKVEKSIEEWNAQRKNTLEKDEESDLVKAIPLRRTGYLCLDIQIPDPHIGVVGSEEGRNSNEQMNEGAGLGADQSVNTVHEEQKDL